MSHIAVERNRRKQMNEHLRVLRSLTPCFYIKRGDQASIIGGVIEFIKELHQVLQTLESNKRRKRSSLSLSPKIIKSPNIININNNNNNNNIKEVFGIGSSSVGHVAGGGASCNSCVADVEAKISGSNVMLKIICKKIWGQIVNIITVLENLSFQILHLNISTMEGTVLYSFIVKIGLECEVSLEELVYEVQQSFCSKVLYLCPQ